MVLLLLCVPLFISVHERLTIEREMAARLYELQQEKNELLERKESLEERVQYLKDDRGIEAEIRRHFDVAKAGEQVVIILDDESKEELKATSALKAAPTPSPWYMFWRE